MTQAEKPSKLKRDRQPDSPSAPKALFPNSDGPVIETRSPTEEDPSLRRYLPNPELNPDSEFSRLLIIIL